MGLELYCVRGKQVLLKAYCSVLGHVYASSAFAEFLSVCMFVCISFSILTGALLL